jgi:dTDP-4-dehydrorhamnose reductase
MCTDISRGGFMRIGVLGYKGRLGSQLVHMGCEPIEYDILSEKELKWGGDVIINCAAKTDVDACEEKEYYTKATRVNGFGVKYLLAYWPGKVIHLSTDYVFAGKRGPYSEKYFKKDDLPTKKMGYGITKMVGELFSEDREDVTIVRTTGLYGGISEKLDFVKMILNAYESQQDEIRIAKDLNGNQTYVPHLADALILLAKMTNPPKLIHIASKDVISRYEFALMIASVYGLDKSKIVPVKSADVSNWIAERPKKGGLKVDFAIRLGLPIYTILEGLEALKGK